MRRFFGLAVLAGVMATVPVLLACIMGSAALVRRDQYGGVLALRGHQGQAREDAQQQMTAHCRGPFTVVTEEQVVVGQQSQSGQRTDYDEHESGYGSHGGQSTSTSSTTRDLTELHITYQCGGQQPVAAQAPPPVAAPVAPPPAQGPPQAQPAPGTVPVQ